MRCLFVLFCVYFFFPLAVKLIGPRMGCQFFKKNADFSDTHSLKEIRQVLVFNFFSQKKKKNAPLFFFFFIYKDLFISLHPLHFELPNLFCLE